MAGRSGRYTLRADEILSRLEESDIDLSEGEENDDTSYTPRPEEDKEPGSSSSDSSDEEEDSQSEVSLQSSVVERGRSRCRSRRTRPYSRRGRTYTRGGTRQPATPISDEWNGQFEPLEIPFYQSKYKKIETELWTPEAYFMQYINDDILEEIVNATNRTSILRKGNSLGLTIYKYMFDLAVCNAWLLYKQKETEAGVNKYKIPQLRSFKLNLGTSLIEQNTVSSDSESLDETEELQAKHKKRKVLITPIPEKTVRYHKAEHLMDYSDKQKRCRNPKCSNTTTAFCTKCNIFLCSTPKRNCHLTFHKK